MVSCSKITGVVVVLIAVLLGVLREHNIRGPRLWLDPIPTADLSHDGMVGKTVIVTGANTGIGKEMSVAIAAMGANVVMACRSLQRGEAAAVEIRERARTLAAKTKPGRQAGSVDVLELDVGSFASVRRFVDKFNARKTPLHVLLNNAAISTNNTGHTVDGLGEIMGVNHFGVFLLTHLLLPNLFQTKGRIVLVASDAHKYSPGFDMKNLDFKDRPEHMMDVYGSSKLANIIMTRQLAKRLEGSGVTVTVNHPGFIKTELVRHLEGAAATIIAFAHNTIAMDAWQGAQNSIYLATAPELAGVSGKYFVQFRQEEPVFPPGTDEEAVWKITEQKTGVKSWNNWKQLIATA